MKVKILFMSVFILGVKGFWKIQQNNPNPAFDPKFYEDVLDPEQCTQQLNYLTENVLLAMQFVDASAKFPQGIMEGNLVDYGNYKQCLSIDFESKAIAVKGKYCSVTIDIGNIMKLPIKSSNISNVHSDANLFHMLSGYYKFNKMLKEYNLRLAEGETEGVDFIEDLLRQEEFPADFALVFRFGMCIPKSCTTREALNSTLFSVPADMAFTEDYCRLPNDKPWSPADTAATIIFAVIGAATLISTGYDLICNFILIKDSKDINAHLQIFSAYTNGRRLVNFPKSSGSITCLDGIRVLATVWVVLGHTTSSQMKYINIIGLLTWLETLDSVYITAAPMTVDTFFTIAGILLVYTTCGKINGRQLIRSLPLFYLNRLLRMFPLLALVVLLQASFFHRLSDGPMWKSVTEMTDNCRTNWWITLLHAQNFVNNHNKCLPHSWYIGIDIHLYIMSPLVLFWVLRGSKKTAWMALIAGLLAALTAGTVYSFNKNFIANIVGPADRVGDMADYFNYYYTNTITRASPFFVGMVFGYILHINKGNRVYFSWLSIILLWSCTAAVLSSIFFLSNFVLQPDWDHQFVNNILNSFMRPAWGAAIGWIVFACVHGYGGPVNWFLSLRIWRLPARLCYGVYLFHYALMYVVADSVITPVLFAPPRFTFMFVAHLSISFIVSYFATLLIDAPFSALFKTIFEGQKKKDSYHSKGKEQAEIAEKATIENGVGNDGILNLNCKLVLPVLTVNNLNTPNVDTVNDNDSLENNDSGVSTNYIDNANINDMDLCKNSIVVNSNCSDISIKVNDSIVCDKSDSNTTVRDILEANIDFDSSVIDNTDCTDSYRNVNIVNFVDITKL